MLFYRPKSGPLLLGGLFDRPMFPVDRPPDAGPGDPIDLQLPPCVGAPIDLPPDAGPGEPVDLPLSAGAGPPAAPVFMFRPSF